MFMTTVSQWLTFELRLFIQKYTPEGFDTYSNIKQIIRYNRNRTRLRNDDEIRQLALRTRLKRCVGIFHIITEN